MTKMNTPEKIAARAGLPMTDCSSGPFPHVRDSGGHRIELITCALKRVIAALTRMSH
jgi:hypothetical protein